MIDGDVASLLRGGRVLATGNFRIDRSRARDKLAHFQLAHPEHFVLELIAAGVRAGSEGVAIRHDADDIAVSWRGGYLPPADELTRLFDWLFNRSEDARCRVLQHLAQGVFGALGLDPSRIVIVLPDRVIDVSDIDTPRIRATRGEPDTLTVHMRRRFGFRVAQAALLRTLSAAHERQQATLHEFARWSSVPVTINGATATRELDQRPPLRALYHQADDALLWIQPEADLARTSSKDAEDTVVAVIRDGVLVERVRLRLGRLRLRGWLRHDAIELDASRARVVDDERRRSALAVLHTRFAELIHRRLTRLGPYHRHVAPLQAALVELIHDHPVLEPHLRHLPVLRDGSRRLWSLARLARCERILRYHDEKLAHAEIGAPHFLALSSLPGWTRSSERAPEAMQWAILTRLASAVGLAIVDADDELRALAIGRAQREYRATVLQALRSRVPGTILHREFKFRGAGLGANRADEGLTRGVLHLLDASHLPEDRLRIELRVDDVPCETISCAFAGPLLAIVAAPGLRANAAFDQVTRDGRFDAVIAGVRREARALVSQVAETLQRPAESRRGHERMQRFLCHWLAHLPTPADDDIEADDPTRLFATRARDLPADVRAAPLFVCVGPEGVFGRRRLPVCLDELFKRMFTNDSKLLVIREELGTDEVAPGTLLARPHEFAALHNVLGAGLVDVSAEVIDLRIAARRRASAGATAMISGPARHHLRIREPELHGELAIADDAELGDCHVQLIRDGVDLGSHELPLGLPGTVASLEWSAARPNRSWTGIADPCQLLMLTERLTAWRVPLLERAAGRLELGLDHDVPAWFAAGVATTGVLPAATRDQPCIAGLSGQRYTLADVLQWRRGVVHFIASAAALAAAEARADVNLRHILLAQFGGPHAHPDRAPRDVLVLDRNRVVLVAALVPGARVLSCDEALHTLLNGWDRFSRLARTPCALGGGFFLPGAAIADPALRGHLALALEGGELARVDHGLVIDVRHQGRPLCRLAAPYPLPMRAVIEGPELVPNLEFRGLATTEMRARVVAAVRAALPAALSAACGDLEVEATGLSPDTLARHYAAPRRLLLTALLNDPRALGLTPETLGELFARLRHLPLLPAPGGRLLRLARLVTLADADQVAIIAPGSMPGRSARTLVYDDPTLRALQASGHLPALPIVDAPVSVAVTPTQATDAHRQAATARVTIESALVWVGFLRDGNETTRSEWTDGHRILARTQRRTPSPLFTRTRDLDVTADPHGPAMLTAAVTQRTTRAIEIAVEALARALADASGDMGEQTRTIGCSTVVVTLLDAHDALAHVPPWLHASQQDETLDDTLAELPLFSTSQGERLSWRALTTLAARGPLRTCAPTVRGQPLDETRPVIRASAALRASLVRVLPPIIWFDRGLAHEHELRAPDPPALLVELPAPTGFRGWLQVYDSAVAALWSPPPDGEDGQGVLLPDTGPVPFVGVLVPDAGDASALPAALGRIAEDTRTALANRGLEQDALALWVELVARAYADDVAELAGRGGAAARARSLQADAAMTTILRKRCVPGSDGRTRDLASLLRANTELRRLDPEDVDPGASLLRRSAVILSDRLAGRLRPLLDWVPALWRLPPRAPEISSHGPDVDADTTVWLARERLEIHGTRAAAGASTQTSTLLRVTLALHRALDRVGVLEWIDGDTRRTFESAAYPGLYLRVAAPRDELADAVEIARAPVWITGAQLDALTRAIGRLVASSVPSIRELASARAARAALQHAARVALGARGSLARRPWFRCWQHVPLFTQPDSGGAPSATIADVLASLAAHGCVLVGTHAPPAGGPLTLAPDPIDRALLTALVPAAALRELGDWRPAHTGDADRARASRAQVRERVFALLERALAETRDDDHRAALSRATVNDVLARLRERDPALASAAFADPHGQAGLALAWAAADQCLAESGAAARCDALALALLDHLSPQQPS